MIEINIDIEKCLIDNVDMKNICKLYGGSGIYKIKAFQKYLEKIHNISIEDYITKFYNIERPKCICGICNKYVDISFMGSKIYWKSYKCGRNNGVKEWSEKAKITRKGSNNPMFGKDPWNKNLTKENSIPLQLISNKMSGRKLSDKHKIKLSESAKTRLIHGHTGHKHSDKTKAILREKTIRNIQNGIFKQTNSKPHNIVKQVLIDLKINFEEEKRIGYWAFDFYLDGCAIEVQGDYFHSNPKIYKNGPISKTQKKNFTRDIKKKEYCKKHNIKLIEIWEYDVIHNIDKVRNKLCDLKK